MKLRRSHEFDLQPQPLHPWVPWHNNTNKIVFLTPQQQNYASFRNNPPLESPALIGLLRASETYGCRSLNPDNILGLVICVSPSLPLASTSEQEDCEQNQRTLNGETWKQRHWYHNRRCWRCRRRSCSYTRQGDQALIINIMYWYTFVFESYWIFYC